MPAEHVWKRVEGVREALGKSDAEALVLFVFEGANWESMYYLTGFRGTSSAAVVTKKDAFLITDGRYLSQAQLQSPFTIVPQGQRHIHEAVGEVLSGAGVTQAGFEGERISFAFHKKLSDMPVRWHDLSEVLPKLRRCKDLLERQFVEKAASIAGEAFLRTLAQVTPGMTERRVAALLEFAMKDLGAEGGWEDEFIVASGPRNALPHGRASDRILQAGEWVTVDFGAQYGGYVCDLTRNFSLGAPDPWARDLHALLLEAQRAGVRALRHGASGRDVDAAARRVIEDAGFGGAFSHGLGHGFGLHIHEAPRLSYMSEDTLASGDLVTVEPGVYFEGRGGMRVEDDYWVTDLGAVCLSPNLSQEFFVVS